jgi:hypothetical protein
MNCSEANNISIIGYLASQGISPTEVQNNHVWYCSPFRNEAQQSFKVNRNLNQWYDFGTGEHGKLIDLVCKIKGVTVTGALIHLQRPDLQPQSFSFGQHEYSEPQRITIKHIQPLQNRALIQYLEARNISPALAASYLKEAYYTTTNKTGQTKQYFALAFENDIQGYELRNRYFKGCTTKAITTIPAENKKALNLFEGFIDFLSALQYYNVTRPNCQTIVLNSLTNIKDINLDQYEKINLFLDNDEPGQKATAEIKAIHPRVKDYAKIIYPDHKDFNEFIKERREPAPY